MSVSGNQLQVEILQPEISGDIHRVTMEELKNWVKDGKLLPHHKVRIKNLSWIEAQDIQAVKSLFEEKRNALKSQPNGSDTQSLFDNTVSEILKPKKNEATDSSKKQSLFRSNSSGKSKEEDDVSDKDAPKNIEPSVAFKRFEEKALAKSKKGEAKTDTSQIEAKPEPHQITAERRKKSFSVRDTLSFLAGCILMCLLSLGGSYLWVYQLKTPPEVDQKNLPELTSLEYKLDSDKVELRLKAAAKEKELSDNNQPAQQPNISQSIAALETQHNIERKKIIENHSNKLQDADFQTTFYFSFVVFLGLFLIARILRRKTVQPIENRHSPKSLSPEIADDDDLDIPTTISEKVNVETPQIIVAVKVSDSNGKELSATHSAKSPDVAENPDVIIQIAEKSDAPEFTKVRNCLLHRDESATYICEVCANYFCADCPVEIKEQENCCPFCKAACKLVNENSEVAIIQSEGDAAEEKKKSLYAGKGANSNFRVRARSVERYRLGIIPAFVIALLFSISISIFWVYKISPYLENRNKEISQNASPTEATKTEKTGTANSQQQQTANANTAAVNSQTGGLTEANEANEPCIDPQTRKPFECDEETRRVLYDHTTKVKSVEKAQKETEEKTDTILSLVLPSEKSASEDTNQENQKSAPAEAARKKIQKQQFIKTFIYSFLIIFGLLLSPRFFSKTDDKQTDTDSPDAV